jgi:hypothetical protein
MLGLVLLVIIVGNVFLSSFQMNQMDSDKIQEKLDITNVAQQETATWITAQNEFTLNIGTRTDTFLGTCIAEDGTFETFIEAIAQTLFPHIEAITVNGESYLSLSINSATSAGYTADASMATAGRTLFAKALYSLAGSSSFSASTWTVHYRAWQDAQSAESTITNSPGSCYSLGQEWTKPTNAYTDDGISAYSVTKDEVESYSGYNFDIPEGAQISQVRIRLDANNGGNDYINVRVSVDGGSSWLKTVYPVYLVSSETTNWVDVTSWTKWTPDQLNKDNIHVQVTHKKSGGADSVSIDWIPVEVTYLAESATAYVDVDVKILRADGTVRTTLATAVGASSNLGATAQTLSGTYNAEAYNVVSQTDYLEIDYYVNVASAGTGYAHLRIDDKELADSEQTRITGMTAANAYRLNIENSYSLDLQDTPLSSLSGLEVLLVYNASELDEKWIIRAYNWETHTFSDAGFNDTMGTQPETAGSWSTYALQITENWKNYVSSTGEVRLQISDGSTGASQTSISIDFLGVKALIGGTGITLKNSSASTVHIIALWVNSPTIHNRYDLDLYLNSGKSTTTFPAEVEIPTGSYILKAVTERGTIAVYSNS